MGRGARYAHVEYYIKQCYRQTNSILEIGCGGARYRNLFPPGSYLGTDVINPYYQDPGDVDVYCSADALPFKDNTFDMIFSQAAIDFMPHLMQVLRETYRVLYPGGEMLVFTYNKNILERIHREAKNAHHKSHRHYNVFTEKELMDWLCQVGYEVKWLPPNPEYRALSRKFFGKISLLDWYIKRKSTWRIFLVQKPR